jgi:hypothetical protein
MGTAGHLFETSDRCMACHNGLITPSGEDVSIGFNWRASMMANSARDPYWQAAVRRETLDHPQAAAAIEDECSKCHMPMMRYEAHVAGGEGQIFANLPVGGTAPAAQLAADGVSCTMCHQIGPNNLGTDASFVGGFEVNQTLPVDQRQIFGPFVPDSGRVTIMRSASGFRPTQGAHLQTAELCATCHTLITNALDAGGNHIGRLPEQVPYLEWRHSAYRGRRTCQSCHMPEVQDSVAVTGVLGQPRANVNRHVFRGGNFFMLRMLNRYRADLGVMALPQELSAAAERTVDHLQTNTAELEITRATIADGALAAEVAVRNLTGHKFPTAYPSRRAWLHFTVTDGDGDILFESGALTAIGSIVGNANDEDSRAFEPHYDVIDDESQVQIYEPILGGPDGAVTTGLLTAASYLKDNRLLPDGFDKTTAEPDIAVHGEAGTDDDFGAGGDRVGYLALLGDAPGPYSITVELWYQPIGYRWANNLRSYDAPETNRFVSYYDAMAGASAVVVAVATLALP